MGLFLAVAEQELEISTKISSPVLGAYIDLDLDASFAAVLVNISSRVPALWAQSNRHFQITHVKPLKPSNAPVWFRSMPVSLLLTTEIDLVM